MIPDGLAQTDMILARWDTSGRFIYVSPLYAKAVGRAAAEINGENVERDYELAAIYYVVASGEPLQVINFAYPENYRTGQNLQMTLTPLRGTQGNVVGVQGIGRLTQSDSSQRSRQ